MGEERQRSKKVNGFACFATIARSPTVNSSILSRNRGGWQEPCNKRLGRLRRLVKCRERLDNSEASMAEVCMYVDLTG